MYLWLQRKKGNLIEDDQEFISQVTAFALTPTADYVITTSLSELEGAKTNNRHNTHNSNKYINSSL